MLRPLVPLAITLAVLGALGALGARPASALTRAHRLLGEELGLPITNTTVVASDARGLLWVGTRAGLARWDGEHFEPIGAQIITGRVHALGPLPNGDVLVRVDDGLLRVAGPAITPEPTPAGLKDLCVETDGTTWIVADGVLFSRLAEEPWRALPTPRAAQRVYCEGGVFVTSGGDTVTVHRDSSTTELLARTRWGAQDVAVTPDGSRWVLPWLGPLVRVRPDGTTIEMELLGTDTGVSLAVRGARLWVSGVGQLHAIDPDGAAQSMHARHGWSQAGDLHVDHEGGLWLTGGRGLMQLPEPDTYTLDVRDGLIHDGTRFVVPDGERSWFPSWGGLSSVGPEGVRTYGPVVRGPVCVAPDGVWGLGQLMGDRSEVPDEDLTALLHVVGEMVEIGPGFEGDNGGDCALDRSGRPWFEHEGQLYSVTDGHLVPGPERPDTGYAELRGDRGALWMLGGATACSLDPVTDPEAWACHPLPSRNAVDVFDRGDGRIWFATSDGVVELRDGEATLLAVPPGERLDSLHSITPSPRGGVWLAGPSFVARAEHDANGWTVLERLGFGHGLVRRGAGEVHERDNGDLVLAVHAGAVFLPASARDRSVGVPTLHLLGAEIEGEPTDPAALTLPWQRALLELRFVATTWRDRAGLRYRYRSDGGAWLDSLLPHLQLLRPRPGRQTVEAQASLDGVTWSAPVVVEFSVQRPPWTRWWAWLLYGFAIAAVVVTVFRLRLREELALRSERDRIALDLHDEIGSALAGLGLGAGMLGSERVGEEARRALAERMASQARELGRALTDVVWSLRAGPQEPQALLDYLTDRGRMILGDRAELLVQGPASWPSTSLSPTVARTLLMVALEALNNAARHAGAKTVTIGLQPGAHWVLSVADDGRGMGVAETRVGGGVGLDGMRRRAERIGGRLEIASGDAGTTVTLTFSP